MLVRPWFLLAMLLTGNAYASDSDVPNQVNKQPDADLLEFLGEWETPDGAWFDPMPNGGNDQEDDQGHGNNQNKEIQDETS